MSMPTSAMARMAMRMDPAGRARAGGDGVDDVAVKRARDPLGHLAARGVAGAEKEDASSSRRERAR